MALSGPLRFPKGVGTNEVPSFIVFRPMKAKFGTYDSLIDMKDEHGSSFAAKTPADYNVSQFTSAGGLQGLMNQVTGVGGIVDNIANGALSSLKSIAGGALNITGDVSLFGGAINAKLNIGDIIGGFLGKTTQTTAVSGNSINLYMPPELEMGLNANYATENVKATTVAAIQSFDKIKAAKGFNGNIDALIETAIAGATSAATEFATSGQIGAANQIMTGRAGNNYTFRLFNNMSHRSFSYSFRLIARNAKDTEVIKGICDNFMEYMLPIKSQSELYFYDIPYMWDIKYMHLGSENAYLDQPNMCFLENVAIKYGTDGGGHAYTNGAPIDVTLTLQFTEVEPLRRASETKYKQALSDNGKTGNPVTDGTFI